MQKKTLATTLIVVGAVLIVISAVGLFLTLIDRSSHKYFFAASGSMEPAIDKGDCVKVKLRVTIDEIYAAPKPDGDIIAFHKPTYPSDVILHRAVGSGTDTSYYLITQGDANMHADVWRVRESNIIGKVIEINPPFLLYSYIFWAVILTNGISMMVGGLVVRKPKRVEIYQGDKAVKTEAAAKCMHAAKGYKLDFEDPTSTNDDLVIAIGDGVAQRFPIRYNSINDLTLNQWHQIVGTFDGTIAKLYIDGELKSSSDAVTYTIVNDDAPLGIGQEVTGASGHFNGLIDSVMVYNRALSTEEVEAQYTSLLP